jgi:hypothetical protein
MKCFPLFAAICAIAAAAVAPTAGSNLGERWSSGVVATAAENGLNILRTTSFAAASDCQNRVPSLLLCRSRSLPERRVV